MRRTFAFLALAALLLAGCATPTAEVDPQATPPLVQDRPQVVLAVVDTGINFYHQQYQLDAALSPLAVSLDVATLTRLGVPELVSVELALDPALAWEDAVEQDRERLLDTFEPRTLYTFPGTRILAAISFQESGGQRCEGGGLVSGGSSECVNWPLLLDLPGGHGTMTTSRAIGNTISIGGAEPDIHLVLVQGFTAEAVRWVADQPWIDMVSISAGISPFGIVPGVPHVLDKSGLFGESGIAAYNYLAHRKPFFASTGNGVGNAGTVGYPSWTRGSSGVPNAISVGANNNDEMSHWHNQDGYVSADGCDNPSADSDDTESVSDYGGGTSSATPFSAGGGAKLLLEARRRLHDLAVGPRSDDTLTEGEWTSQRAKDATVVLAKGEPGLVADGPLADGLFTLTEFKQTLYTTALAVPTDDESDGAKCFPLAGGFPGGENLPPAARFPVHGYGEVNHASIGAAIAVLRGEQPMPERAEDDAAYELAHHRKMAVVGDAE